MVRSKIGAILLCMIVVFGGISIRYVSNSPKYLDWRIERIKRETIDIVVQDELGWQGLAINICEESRRQGNELWYDEHRSDFSQELYENLMDVLNQSPVEFDVIYVGGQTQLIYPQGCCVFRRTIEYRHGVYAWVDLVYTPSYDDEALEWYRNAEEIMPNWYITVLFGF